MKSDNFYLMKNVIVIFVGELQSLWKRRHKLLYWVAAYLFKKSEKQAKSDISHKLVYFHSDDFNFDIVLKKLF